MDQVAYRAAPAADLSATRHAQARWAQVSVRDRLRVIKRLRYALAERAQEISSTVPTSIPSSLHRTQTDTLVAEVLPLVEACRFLEREAEFVLAPRQESTQARPLWLSGVSVRTERSPLGLVLVIGPGNYPLFLPGAQAIQALAAGNAVLWKPAPGGKTAADLLRILLIESGMEAGLLTILDTAPSAAQAAIAAGVDKVFLTGSAESGRAVMHTLAETLTPSVLELSGCDAVFVLEGADVDRAVEALTFGIRMNGSATCMAPRRVFVAETVAVRLAGSLTAALDALQPVPLAESTRTLLRELLLEASLEGARVLLDGLDGTMEQKQHVSATLLNHVTPEMRIAQTDIFAPVLSLMPFSSIADAIAAHARCPYALTAAIFGPAAETRRLAAHLTVGTVLINDLIISTADPRVSFGGRKQSGFGSTRGREGLLAMTEAKVIVEQRSRSRVPYRPTGPAHGTLFAGYLRAMHGGTLRTRWQGLRAMIKAAATLR